jgi:long-chain acyl-CoA synthetase
MKDYGLDHFAALDPHSEALIDTSGRGWTRLALSENVNALARALQQRGLTQGDTLAILAPNCFEFLTAYLAATRIGLYVVPVNWHLSVGEVAYILEDAGVRALFAHERLRNLVLNLPEAALHPHCHVRVSFGQIPGMTPIAELMEGHGTEPLLDTVMGRVLMYTSATTGRPKAISLPIQDAATALDRTIRFHMSCGINMRDDNVHLAITPLYHAAPLEFAAIALYMGHPVVLVERWEPELLLQLIQQYRVTTSVMVPAMFVRLLKLPPAVRAQYDVSSLRLVAHSAAPCPVEIKRELISWWGPLIWEGYGAAEGSGTAVSSQEWLAHPGSVGRAMPGTTLRVLDEEGRPLPSNQVGTIYFSRYTGDRFEYKNDPQKTAAAYRGDLFTVGDLGYLDPEGYLYICDRKIDMIICGGTNVYSAEVEQVLIQHPGVLDCAVLGIPDALMGEAVHAVIQVPADVVPDAKLTADIMSFLRGRLSAMKLPRRIEYADQLPRDPNGKLYKRLLREKYRPRQQ